MTEFHGRGAARQRRLAEARLIAAAVAVVEAAKEYYERAGLAPHFSGPFAALVEAVDAWRLEQ